MLKHFLPNEHVKSIFEIKPDDLTRKGIKGIITDLDNTLVAWDNPEATPELIEWLKTMKDAGILVTIVSNNNEVRVKAFSDPLKVPFIYRARKPLVRSFKRAIRDMDLKPDDIVVIGDQLLTDVLGGNRLGLHTILVVPVAMSDGWMTRFNRKMERRILSSMRKKGLIDWED
ncbi:YqeG family HAD IIIA-type phosphatase [Scopulibacillus cellulosilyticus]|uniref:YqeG family HAD IIIA-type phosphatase n=1 Tax=Scopulibacillus cellulosilyticus TaxID=2665665 RepID=A0ABW2PY99_9BACL